MEKLTKWDERFFELAQLVAQWSKDESRKVGCVIVDQQKIVLSLGYNGFPRGIDDKIESRKQRPLKYFFTEHAEKNAIFNAASVGRNLKGSTLYCTLFPCAECAKAIIQSGISEIISLSANFSDKNLGKSFKVSNDLLCEAQIKIKTK